MTVAAEPWRWTLEEYVLRCELDDGIREVVVEGALDHAVYEDALRRWSMADVQVIDSGSLAVTPSEIEQAGFTQGVKGMLLTLAASLEPLAARRQERLRVTIIVDRDYDDYISTVRYRTVCMTDGYSIESYAISATVLDRFVRVVLGRHPPSDANRRTTVRRTVSGAELYDRLLGAAIQIAAVRLVLRSAPPRLAIFDRWPDYAVIDSGGDIAVKAELLLRNVLSRAARANEYDDLLDRFSAEVARAGGDVFRLVRGHDFFDLMAKLLRSKWGRGVAGIYGHAKGQALARVMLPLVDDSRLDEFPLFAELRARYQ